jgi:hypothetical protein
MTDDDLLTTQRHRNLVKYWRKGDLLDETRKWREWDPRRFALAHDPVISESRRTVQRVALDAYWESLP